MDTIRKMLRVSGKDGHPCHSRHYRRSGRSVQGGTEPTLTRQATGSSRLVLDDGDVRTVVVLAQNRLAVFLGARTWLVAIAAVACLNGRVRPLLKCPRAHEGNFQSLYWTRGELACRRCHGLRYSTTLSSSAIGRVRLARQKLLCRMGSQSGMDIAERKVGGWRKKYARQLIELGVISQTHYVALKAYLKHKKEQALTR